MQTMRMTQRISLASHGWQRLLWWNLPSFCSACSGGNTDRSCEASEMGCATPGRHTHRRTDTLRSRLIKIVWKKMEGTMYSCLTVSNCQGFEVSKMSQFVVTFQAKHLIKVSGNNQVWSDLVWWWLDSFVGCCDGEILYCFWCTECTWQCYVSGQASSLHYEAEDLFLQYVKVFLYR